MAGRTGVSAGLKEIVGDYEGRGVDLSADPRLAEAILLDSFPEAPAEIHALVEAIRSGAIQYMRDRAAQGAEFSIQGAAAQLAEGAGLREDLSRWAVESWWNALSVGPPIDMEPKTPGASGPGTSGMAAAAVVAPIPSPSPPPSMPPAQPLAGSNDMTRTVGEAAPMGSQAGGSPGYPSSGPPPGSTGQPYQPGTPSTGPTNAPGQSGYGAGGPSYAPGQGAPSGGGPSYAPGQSGYGAGGPSYAPGQGAPSTGPQPQFGGPGYPAGGGPPPGAAGPPQQNSQRRVLLIVGIIVVVILAYVGIAAGAKLPPFKKSAAATTTTTLAPATSTSPSTSTTPTTPPTVTTIPTVTTSATLSQKLDAAIPTAVTSSCTPIDGAALASDAPGAAAGFNCTPDTGLAVQYVIYPTEADATNSYKVTISKVTNGLKTGVCAQKNDVQGTYTQGTSKTPAGELACFTTTDGQILLWNHFSDAILTFAKSATLTRAQEITDWDHLGPF